MCLNLWELWAFENALERDPENDENEVWISQLIWSKSLSANSISRCKYWFAWVMTRIKQIIVQITKVVNFAWRFSKPQARSLETFPIIALNMRMLNVRLLFRLFQFRMLEVVLNINQIFVLAQKEPCLCVNYVLWIFSQPQQIRLSLYG